MEFMGTSEASKKWGINQAYISKLCRESKIPGAEHDGVGKPWRIPVDAKNPSKRENE